jgi:hypothetical protein
MKEMNANPTENTKDRNCKNCHYLKYPDNFPAGFHRAYDCSKGKWNDSIRGINPTNPHGVRSPKLDYTCEEYSPDLRNHAIPDQEKIHAQNRQRELERDEWNRSKHSDDFKKRRRRRTRRKYFIEHLRGEPSFMKKNINDEDSGVPSPRGLEALEDLLPPGSICLGVFEDEVWNATVWRTEIHFYLVKSHDPNFLWDLCGINWDDNWGRYNWELYSRITNIKDPYMAGFLLVENLWDSSYKNTRANPYRNFLTAILDK